MIEQRSEAWFAARKGRVTGSMVGAILGLSPYMSRDDAMRAMVREYHDAPREFTGNAATAWGTAMEAHAVAEFEMKQGLVVKSMPFVPCDDWLGSSPDGETEGRGLEVKCPYGIRNDPDPVFKTLDDQPHYRAQTMIEMHCCGWSELHFWQWTPHGNSHELVKRDDDWLNQHLPILRQFHAEFLDACKDPAEYLEPLRITIDTPAAALMVAEYDQLSEAISLAEERKKDLLSEMVALAGERNSVFGGRKLTLTRKAGSVSYAKAVKELCPDADLSKWAGKPSSYWGLK